MVGNSTIASLPNKLFTAFDTNEPYWTQRELLTFPDLMPGQYTLPFFLHNSMPDSVLFTDTNGNVLQFCEDQLYEALDHRMLWINQSRRQWGEDVHGEWEAANWQASIYMYFALDVSASSTLVNASCLEALPSRPSEVLLFADYFCNDKATGSTNDSANDSADLPHMGWERLLRPGEDIEVSSGYVWVGPLPEAEVDTQGSRVNETGDPAEPPHRHASQALRIDPGLGRVALHHQTFDGVANRAGGCLHLRAHFFDTLDDKRISPGHWMGLTCQYGSAVVGLEQGIEQCYAFLNGACPDGCPSAHAWQASNVLRSHGWHLFEILVEGNSLSIVIDGEVVADVPSEGRNFEAEEVWLVAKRGGVGHWAAVELLHTPPSSTFRGAHRVAAGDRQPWKVESKERGRWQIIKKSSSESVVRGNVEIEEAQSVDLDSEPPPVPVPRPWTAGALTIECWSLPVPESDIARIERVMAIFAEQLIAAGVIMPENFQRVGRCGARTDPQPCYIYRFGTRRLHISIREMEGARLCLVVRCGGGFIDFAEFARKHGSIVQLKFARMQRRPGTGRDVLQLASVFKQGERRVREIRQA